MWGIVLVAVGGLLLINGLFMAFHANFNIGVVLQTCVSLAVLLYGIFWKRFKRIPWMNRTALVAVAVWAALIGFLCIYGNADNVRYDEDAVIILGAGIRGERVTLPLARRLDKAVAYHAKNPTAVLVVSGVQGPQEDIAI